MQTSEKQQVIKAIGELDRRVTAADVATKTGLPLLVVQQVLNQVASETGGHLQVATTGDIAYAFSPGFSNAYLAKGLQAFFGNVAEKIWAVFMYLLRISFGIMLILSLIIVVVMIMLIIFVLMRGSGGNDRDSGDGDFFNLGGDFHFTFWDWMIIRDLLWWNTYTYHEPVRYRYDQPTIRARRQSNFLLNCFSFLFGDGDPNEGLDEKRWQLIAQVIKRNNNVLTAEQLAPYTGADPKNEDAVLPVLVRFNGRPEVTESGNIIYVFESMQSTAADLHLDPPSYLKEFGWKFTNVPGGDMTSVYVVSFLNFCGAWFLWYFAHTHLHMTKVLAEGTAATAASGLSGILMLINCLVVYGTAFLAIPAIRAVVQNLRNKAIEDRNTKRFRYAQVVANPTLELGAKLKESVNYRVRSKHIDAKDVVYTTQEDAIDQEDDLSSQFKQLEKKEKSSGQSGTEPAGSKRGGKPLSGHGEKPSGKSPPGTPEVDHPIDDDAGNVIDIRKKLEREFDASP